MKRPIRMLSVGLTNFREQDAPVQLNLFDQKQDEHREKQMKLDSTVDAIRRRFGPDSISFGQLMDTDLDGSPEKKKKP